MTNSFSEKDFQEFFVESLIKEGHREGDIYQYVKLGSYGEADVVHMSPVAPEGDMSIQVYELKVEPFNFKQLLQLARYMTGVKHLFRGEDIDLEISGTLVIPKSKLENNDYCFLLNFLPENIGILQYELTLDKGIILDEFYMDTSFIYTEDNFSKKEHTFKNIGLETYRKTKENYEKYLRSQKETNGK